MSRGPHILTTFARRWKRALYLQTGLYALGMAVLVFFVSQNLWLALGAMIVTSFLAAALIKPWKPTATMASSYIDAHLESAEYSSGLLLASSDELSGLARLQEHKITSHLREVVRTLKPPAPWSRSLITTAVLIMLGFLAYQFNVVQWFNQPGTPIENTAVIPFTPVDSTQTSRVAPAIQEQWVTIRYPAYTGVPAKRTSEMNIKAVIGATVSWQLDFDTEVKGVSLQSLGNDYPMKLNNASFTGGTTLATSGFYNFRFEDLEGNPYLSDLYAIEAIKDASPTVEIKGLKQFTTFNYFEDKVVQFSTAISDDFGIADAHIVATVSKGSGESVKFREEKLYFESGLNRGSKSMLLSKKIDLDALKMEPGDELYFYVETADYKTPGPNISRSETYFATIKDTTSYEFSLEGTLGVDLMPDYFRSQRQLIIDTEKLISERKRLSEYDFNFRSNELGYDQKALRDKYGEFMGIENEIAIAETGPEVDIDGVVEEDHDHEDEDEDPLSEYTHDHDGSNEHNLVDTHDDHDHEDEEDSDNPLAEYMHDHGDPEMGTLFQESLKAKLLKALGEMWDAELYLRLYEPEKSLPYQYRALKLIQDIKNSARIYVHRIGFDPPPIKEESRLSGDLDEVHGYRKSEDAAMPEEYPNIRSAVVLLGDLISQEKELDATHRQLLEQAGNELAGLAVEFPGAHLSTLQQLKWAAEGREMDEESLRDIRKGLFRALPEAKSNPVRSARFMDAIDTLLLKELEVHDE